MKWRALRGYTPEKVVAFHLESSITQIDIDSADSLTSEKVMRLWAEDNFKSKYLTWKQAQEATEALMRSGVLVAIVSDLPRSLAVSVCAALEINFHCLITRGSGKSGDLIEDAIKYLSDYRSRLSSSSADSESSMERIIFVSDSWFATQAENYALHGNSRMAKSGYSPDFELLVERCLETPSETSTDEIFLFSFSPWSSELNSLEIDCYSNLRKAYLEKPDSKQHDESHHTVFTCRDLNPRLESVYLEIRNSILSSNQFLNNNVLMLDSISAELASNIIANRPDCSRISPFYNYSRDLLDYDLNRVIARKVAKRLSAQYLESISLEVREEVRTFVGPLVGEFLEVAVFVGPGEISHCDFNHSHFFWEA